MEDAVKYIIMPVVLISVLIYLFYSKVPEGYEDENGFHYGKPEITEKKDAL
jgi:hypothetical protein